MLSSDVSKRKQRYIPYHFKICFRNLQCLANGVLKEMRTHAIKMTFPQFYFLKQTNSLHPATLILYPYLKMLSNLNNTARKITRAKITEKNFNLNKTFIESFKHFFKGIY